MKFRIRYGLVIILVLTMISCRNNHNKIKVTTEDGLKVENVEISKGFVSINRENDSELFNSGMTTVFNGRDKNNLKTIFGENDFLVVYDNRYYYSFRHFIESDFVHDFPKGHKYNFQLYKRQDTILCEVDIKGEIPMKFTRAMSEMESAKNRLGNTPKEKAGTVFNMKEMEEK